MNARAKNALIRIYEAKITYHKDMTNIYQEKLAVLKEDDDGRNINSEKVQVGSGRGNELLERQHQDDAERKVRGRKGRSYLDPVSFRGRY